MHYRTTQIIAVILGASLGVVFGTEALLGGLSGDSRVLAGTGMLALGAMGVCAIALRELASRGGA